MRKPNFFIIGAPKCGTTSLAFWLSQHPNIFITNPKEPRYFSPDIVPVQLTERSYLNLFNNASYEHKAVGEASVTYFRSKLAISSILQKFPDSKFIVCIRNPIEMAISLHSQRYYAGVEPERSFSKAWRLQETRRRGKSLPLCSKGWSNLFEYGWMCLLGEQLSNLYSIVDSKNIFVVEFEGLLNPKNVYDNILDFLGVFHDYYPSFTKHNKAKEPLFPLLNRSIRIATVIKKNYFPHLYFGGIAQKILKSTSVEKTKEAIPNDLKKELKEYFNDDIRIISKVLCKDYSHYIEW